MGLHKRLLEGPHLKPYNIELYTIEQYSSTPFFNTKAVVQQTGVPASTLRAWERRYHLLSPERADNTYRLYSERDIQLIRWLKERIDTGMSISQAIALFRHLAIQQKQQSKESEFPLSSRAELRSTFFEIVQNEQSSYFQKQLGTEQNNPFQLFGTKDSNIANQQMIQSHLIEIFQRMDEQAAHVLMRSMFLLYSVEEVCQQIIVPTLWQIGAYWAEDRLSVLTEHFATNFFRALLTNHFYVTPGSTHGPLVIVACSPMDAHEIAALMLALFLRRQGIRVVYLGQSIETTGLLQSVSTLKPALICLSSTMPEYLSELANLSQQLYHLPDPRPPLVFGGQAFVHNQQMVAKIAGHYLEGDLMVIVNRLQALMLGQAECEKAT